MSAQPDYPGAPGGGSVLGRPLLAGLLVTLAIAALALLLPRQGVLKKNEPPSDLPWFGSGLNSVFVLADGTWIVTRGGYVDRQRRYVLTPQGELTTFSDRGVFGLGMGDDKSGGFSSGVRLTKDLSSISIKPGQPYRSWLFTLRRHGDRRYLNDLPVDDPPLPRRYTARTVPLVVADKPAPFPGTTPGPAIRDAALRSPPSGFGLNLNQHNRIEQFVILDGHWFFETSDNAAYLAPYLYLTTDRQRMLWRMKLAEPPDGHAELTIDRGVRLGIPVDVESSCRLGYDPARGQVFLIRADGSRYWFDPDTLEETGRDRLPGVWEPEYAQLSWHPGEFSPYFGIPLSRRGYERLMQSAMLVFLASLLGLSLLWRPRWKSTSAATTADSSSSADSEATSPDSDTP